MGEFERKRLKKHFYSSAYHLSKQYLVPKHIKKKGKKWLFTFLSNQPWINIIQNSIIPLEVIPIHLIIGILWQIFSKKESKTENQVENACKENQSLEPVTKKHLEDSCQKFHTMKPYKKLRSKSNSMDMNSKVNIWMFKLL